MRATLIPHIAILPLPLLTGFPEASPRYRTVIIPRWEVFIFNRAFLGPRVISFLFNFDWVVLGSWLKIFFLKFNTCGFYPFIVLYYIIWYARFLHYRSLALFHFGIARNFFNHGIHIIRVKVCNMGYNIAFLIGKHWTLIPWLFIFLIFFNSLCLFLISISLNSF